MYQLLFFLATFLLPAARALSVSRRGPDRLLELISAARDEQKAIAVIGVHDALSAKILEQQGAAVLFVSGFGVSASRLGEPDAGILTRSEMEDAARNILSATNNNIPVIVDGDTGFGGASNVQRTIRSMASLGAAAVSIEDQHFPKRCTYVAGSSVNVVRQDEAVKRIQTALWARDEALKQDGNSIAVIARTDCRMSLGLDEAIERCKRFEELGADIVYAENLQSSAEYVQLRKSLDDSTATILAQVQTGDPNQTLWGTQEIGAMGYEMGLFGVSALQATVATLQTTAKELLSGNGLVLSGASLASLETVKEVVGFPELISFEQDYGCT